MSGPAIFLELPLNFIQVLRLAHALVEAGCNLHVSQKDAWKLSPLGKIFGLKYEIGGEGVPRLRGLLIDHLKPETKVGNITRPLIFPIGAFEYCRARWPEARRVRASFPGLPTSRRERAINEWLKLSGLKLRVPEQVGKQSRGNFMRRISKKIFPRLRVPCRHDIFSEGIRLILSDEGRVFPQKAWNEDYYSCLLESEFILCPDGDTSGGSTPWTYRFFESALCGAIPVIEHPCDAYQGFRFRCMDQPLRELVWSRDDAEYNFDLAIKRLTIPPEELRSEVDRLLAYPDAAPASAITARGC